MTEETLLLMVLILVFAVLVLNFLRTREVTDELQEKIDETIEQSKEEMFKAIQPSVMFCSSRGEVKRAAAELIEDAAENFRKYKEKERNKDKNADILDKKEYEEYYIAIYGSASLSVKKSEENDAEHKDYEAAAQKAKRELIPWRRYVSLLTNNDEGQAFKSRTSEKRQEYINWLKHQSKLIAEDPQYTLIVTPRAPEWGTSSTTLLTNGALMEIKADGNAAIVIKGEGVSRNLRRALRDEIQGTKPENISYINTDTVHNIEGELELEKIKRWHEEQNKEKKEGEE